LKEGVDDFDRLKTVLHNDRVFGVVTETDVIQAKEEVATELQPQIASLVKRVEQELTRLERQERTLIAQAELQAVRLGQSTSISSNKPTAEQLERLDELQQAKDRLAYSLKRLDLQKHQARVSLAFGHR
jgi:hypothetical protein